MPFIQKQCELCDGLRKINIINCVTQEIVAQEDCPLCKGKGYQYLSIHYYDYGGWDFRYKSLGEQ